MHGCGELHLEVPPELDALGELALIHRRRDQPVQLLAILDPELEAKPRHGEQVHDLGEREPRRALLAIENAVLDVLADTALVDPEERDDFRRGEVLHETASCPGTSIHVHRGVTRESPERRADQAVLAAR